MLFNAYLVFMGLLTLLPMFLGVYAWRHREIRGARAFALLMLSTILWNISSIFSISAVTPDYAAALFWYTDFGYISVVLVPIFLLFFALEYTGRTRWLAWPRILVFFAVPTLSMLTIWVPTWSYLFIHVQPIVYDGVTLIKEVGYGWVFWLHVGWSYLATLSSLALFVLQIFHSEYPYRQQAVYILVGSFFPFIINAAYVFNIIPDDFPPLNFTALGILPMALTFGWALFRYGLLDVMPVAHNILIENMEDIVVVLDEQDRIVEMNPAGERILNTRRAEAVGKPLAGYLGEYASLVDRFRGVQLASTEVSATLDETGRTFDLKITPLTRRGHLFARLIVLRDITERKEYETRLRSMNTQLAEQLAENERLRAQLREQAIRDPLTGLYNRRYFEETLQQEMARAGRGGYPMSLVMLDIDHFKSINDAYGHQAGDAMLLALSSLLHDSARREDTVCRYGGEEFIILLPDTDGKQALERAEGWRAAFAGTQVTFEDLTFQTTVSIGVAAFQGEMDEMGAAVHMADMAMYAAKQAGRNCVVAASVPQV